MEFLFLFSGTAYAGPSVSGCTGTETDKQIGMWERRIKGLRRMLLGWDQTKPPDPPNFVGIDVTSSNSANLRIQESGEGPISTKFKGEITFRCRFDTGTVFNFSYMIKATYSKLGTYEIVENITINWMKLLNTWETWLNGKQRTHYFSTKPSLSACLFIASQK